MIVQAETLVSSARSFTCFSYIRSYSSYVHHDPSTPLANVSLERAEYARRESTSAYPCSVVEIGQRCWA